MNVLWNCLFYRCTLHSQQVFNIDKQATNSEGTTAFSKPRSCVLLRNMEISEPQNSSNCLLVRHCNKFLHSTRSDCFTVSFGFTLSIYRALFDWCSIWADFVDGDCEELYYVSFLVDLFVFCCFPWCFMFWVKPCFCCGSVSFSIIFILLPLRKTP